MTRAQCLFRSSIWTQWAFIHTRPRSSRRNQTTKKLRLTHSTSSLEFGAWNEKCSRQRIQDNRAVFSHRFICHYKMPICFGGLDQNECFEGQKSHTITQTDPLHAARSSRRAVRVKLTEKSEPVSEKSKQETSDGWKEHSKRDKPSKPLSFSPENSEAFENLSRFKHKRKIKREKKSPPPLPVRYWTLMLLLES